MQIFNKFLFASDLDGTLLPNSTASAAPGCLERTRGFLEQLKAAECPIAYFTGRHLSLAREGQETFKLIEPDYWICNAGTEIYDGKGQPDAAWQETIGPALEREKLSSTFKGVPKLMPLEKELQGPHKLSFGYPGPLGDDLRTWILTQAKDILGDVRLVEGVEELTGQTLLDIIPAATGKAPALYYLWKKSGLPGKRVFYAGDSRNDLDALTSGVCGTLVKNTPPDVRKEAKELANRTANAKLLVSLGCYGDGIIEGILMYGLAGQ